MGAVFFVENATGMDVHKAFKDLYDSAIEEYGNDTYNGTISTTRLSKDVTRDFKNSGKSLKQYINDLENNHEIPKGECWSICIKEPSKSSKRGSVKVEHFITPGTRKWVLKYIVEDNRGDVRKSFDTKGEAVAFAKSYTEKNGVTTHIFMEKVLEKANSLVASARYTAKVEKGKWVFIGLAYN